jgi:hypothetical protein
VRRAFFLPAILWLAWCSVSAGAADLTKIARTIAKEPVYKSKPKYCLLVFGPEAKSRVWLVLDGDVLYVDRNGNGDLTEKNEQIKIERSHPQVNEFRIGDLSLPGDSSYQHLRLAVHRYTLLGAPRDSLDLRITIDKKQWRASFKEFSDRQEDAPVIHFNGPLTFLCPNLPTFLPGKTTNLEIYTGTPGLDDQTFAWRKAREVVGAGRRLIVRISYPNKEPDGEPLRTEVILPLDG